MKPPGRYIQHPLDIGQHRRLLRRSQMQRSKIQRFAAAVAVASEALGQYQGEPIPAWIESQGQRYVFQRASQDGPRTKLGRDEVLYEGRLVYVRDGVHVEV